MVFNEIIRDSLLTNAIVHVLFYFSIQIIFGVPISNNTEKTGPLLLAWHHLNSDFQAFWNLAKHLVFFAAGALDDSIRFGIFVVYQFHPGT
jgi:hypothetical protein